MTTATKQRFIELCQRVVTEQSEDSMVAVSEFILQNEWPWYCPTAGTVGTLTSLVDAMKQPEPHKPVLCKVDYVGPMPQPAVAPPTPSDGIRLGDGSQFCGIRFGDPINPSIRCVGISRVNQLGTVQ